MSYSTHQVELPSIYPSGNWTVCELENGPVEISLIYPWKIVIFYSYSMDFHGWCSPKITSTLRRIVNCELSSDF